MINIQKFGQVVATPQRDGLVPANQGTQVTAAVGQIGQQITDLAEQKQRMQAATQLATINNDLYSLGDEISRGVSDGTIKPDAAQSTFNTRVADIRKTRMEGLSPFQIESMEPALIKTQGALTRGLDEVVLKRTQSDIGASILQTGEELGRAALRDLPGAIAQNDQIVDAMGPKAGWNAVQMGRIKQTFREGATFNFANATLEGAAQTGDIAVVRAAREKIQGPEGEAIDPAKRTALITKAYAYENGIVASGVREQERMAREAEAREKKGRDAFDDAQKLMLNGRYLSQDYLTQLADTTAGTSVAPAVQELVKSQSEVAGFASLPLSQQGALIERRVAAGSTKGVGTDPANEKITNYMQTIHDASVKAYDENAWQAAQERGVIPRAQQFNLTNVQEAGALLGERMKQIDTVEAAAGKKISPLQPQEAEQIARVVRMLPPDQQSGALASFGELVPNADRLAALAKQMHDKDQTLGLAMMLAGDKTTQGRYASELLLRGNRAIKDKSIMIDAARETGWRGQIANEVGDAFPNAEVRAAVIDSAYYINAGFVAEGGSADPKRALRLAVGRIIEHNGRKLPLPRGMEEGDFTKSLKAVQPETIREQTTDGNVYSGRTAIPVAQFMQQLPNASLEYAGQGRYNVRAGGSYVTNSNGGRIAIKVLP